MIKQYWTKQRIWLLIFLMIVGIGALLFTSHNERFYQQPIAKVISEKTVSKQRVKDQFDNVDHQYNQQLQVKLMNGKYRGQKLTGSSVLQLPILGCALARCLRPQSLFRLSPWGSQAH